MFSIFRPPVLDMDSLYADVLYLDPSLIKDGDDGAACFKKFSNERKGVPTSIRIALSERATAVRNGDLVVEDCNILRDIDVFTLLSNHIDQQGIGEKPTEEEKQACVLNLLEAAYHISPKINYETLSAYSPRVLSSHAQLLYHLGRARRYAGIGVEERLVMLQQALRIAVYLNTLGCDRADDPHAYKNRIPTYELPVNYCLQDLKRFDEAAALILPQLELSSPFHLTHANVQLANIFVKKAQHTGLSLDEAYRYAHAAIKVSQASGSSLMEYNARVCLMEVYQADHHDAEANDMASAMIADMDANPDCGAKPLHRKAAEKVLSENVSASMKK